MTNAIEQTKREMYGKLKAFRIHAVTLETLEESLEAHLEQLRQQYEEMAATARDRFESIQSLEAMNQYLSARLSKMTEDRDGCQKRMQAVDHAHFNLDQANRVAGEELRKAHELIEAQRQTIKISESLFKALSETRKSQAGTSAQDQEEIASCERADALVVVLGAMIDCQQIVGDWAVYGYGAKKQMKKLADVLHGTAELKDAMKLFEKADRCMHSFHPAFPGGEQCIFCGEKR